MTTRRDLLRAAAGGILTLAAIDSLPILPKEQPEAAVEGRFRPAPEHAVVEFRYHSGSERRETICMHAEPDQPCPHGTIRAFDMQMRERELTQLSPESPLLSIDPIVYDITIVHLNGRRERFSSGDIDGGTLYT